MSASGLKEWKVFPVGHQNVIHVPVGKGEGLRRHLEAEGIHSVVSPPAETPYERLEVEEGVDADRLQALVDQWRT